MDTPLIGHTNILDVFARLQADNRVSHAYCFVGPEHVGKRALAEQIAAHLLGSSTSVSSDLTIVERLQDEKTGKTKKDISIEQIKQVATTLTRRSLSRGGYKIAVIDHAEEMNVKASNALLKTLEEPTEKSVIFLLTTDDQKLLPTIRSRCQIMRCAPVPTEAIERLLIEMGAKANEAKKKAVLSRGLPGLAISWYHDSDAFERYLQDVERFVSLSGKTFHDKVKSIEPMFGDKTDAIGTRGDISDILALWRLLVRDIWLSSHGHSALVLHDVSPVSWTDATYRAIDASILEAHRRIDQNIHPRLLIEHILLHIP